MTIIDVVSLVGLFVVGIGLVVTWVRNGKSHSRSLGSVEQTLKTVVETVGESRKEVQSIGKELVKVQVNSAKADQKILNLEGEVFHKGKR